jgi:anaerobic selenocysteine-containing dehydrogenase
MVILNTAFIYRQKILYAFAKAIFNIPTALENTSEEPNDQFPFILTTGRIRDQWHTMTKTGSVPINDAYPSPFRNKSY